LPYLLGSWHLRRLVDGGLVDVFAQGRHRYFRLAGPHVAAALEELARIAPPPPKALDKVRVAEDIAPISPISVC